MKHNFIIGTYQCDNYKTLSSVLRESLDCGITAFDTAPSYNTEKVLGKVIKEVTHERGIRRDELYISDKIDAWQMRLHNGDITSFVQKALVKLQTDYIDLLLIHWPIEEYIDRTWECMQMCKDKGLIREIGICNVRERHLEAWKKRGITPSVIQIERHPLRTCNKEIDYAVNNDISVLSYTPLGRMMPEIRDSVVLKEISQKYNKSIAQIILRWHLDTNSIPVFSTKKVGRIQNNTDIFDFGLTKEEIDQIESLNSNYKIYLESWGCPGF